MLILSRHVGESIVVSDNILITLLGIRDNLARIGIQAPSTIEIYRNELYEKIQKQSVTGTRMLPLVT